MEIESHDFYEDPRKQESNIDKYGEDGFETDDTFFPDSWDPS